VANYQTFPYPEYLPELLDLSPRQLEHVIGASQHFFFCLFIIKYSHTAYLDYGGVPFSWLLSAVRTAARCGSPPPSALACPEKI